VHRFVYPKIDDGPVEVECIHNRELVKTVDTSQLFFAFGEDFNKKFDIDTRAGELAVYSPTFEEELGCAWVAQASDFIDSDTRRYK